MKYGFLYYLPTFSTVERRFFAGYGHLDKKSAVYAKQKGQLETITKDGIKVHPVIYVTHTDSIALRWQELQNITLKPTEVLVIASRTHHPYVNPVRHMFSYRMGLTANNYLTTITPFVADKKDFQAMGLCGAGMDAQIKNAYQNHQNRSNSNNDNTQPVIKDSQSILQKLFRGNDE